MDPLDAPRITTHDGDIQAAATLADCYERHQAWLLRWVTARTRDSEAARDIVQEAFVRLVRETKGGRPPRDVGPWLRRVASNLVVSNGRRAAVRRCWEVKESRAIATDPWPGQSAPSPEQIAIHHEQCRCVRVAVDVLGAKARTSLWLAALGYSSREIGTTIGRNDGATRTLLCRARSRARAEFARCMGELPAGRLRSARRGCRVDP